MNCPNCNAEIQRQLVSMEAAENTAKNVISRRVGGAGSVKGVRVQTTTLQLDGSETVYEITGLVDIIEAPAQAAQYFWQTPIPEKVAPKHFMVQIHAYENKAIGAAV